MKKFFLSLALLAGLFTAAPTFAADATCKYPQKTVTEHYSKNERSLWQLNPDKIKGFLNVINQLQEFNKYEADQIIFSVGPKGQGEMYILFFKKDCAVGDQALVIEPQFLFRIFMQLGIRDTDFTRYTYAEPV